MLQGSRGPFVLIHSDILWFSLIFGSMKIKCFEEIIAWQKAQNLSVELYQTYGSLKDYGFRDQILRASVSVSNNIAEGFGRSTDADFVRFLHFSLGSSYEVLSMLLLSKRLKLIDHAVNKKLIDAAKEVIRIIIGFIRHLRLHPKRVSKKKCSVASVRIHRLHNYPLRINGLVLPAHLRSRGVLRFCRQWQAV